MHSKTLPGLLAIGVAASLTLAVSSAAASDQAPSSLCGGEDHQKKKDVKKPAPGDDKKPQNPA